jgi:hypothetical protein
LRRTLHLKVLRFEQERALALVVRIQPFQVEALIGTVVLAVLGPGEVPPAQDLPEHRVDRVRVGGGE